jgi:hypothetical protein
MLNALWAVMLSAVDADIRVVASASSSEFGR